MTRSSRTLSALVVVCLALAACGDSKPKASTSSTTVATTTTAKSTTTTTRAPTPGADLAVAKAAVLAAGDLPGYTPAAPDGSSSDQLPEASKKEFATCMKVDTTFFDDIPGEQKAESGDFDKGDATVSGTVSIDPTAAEVDKGWTAFSAPSTEKCLEDLFRGVFAAQKSITVSAVKNTRFDVAVGPRALGYQLQVQASAEGVPVTVYLDFVLAVRDRAAIQLVVVNPTVPFDRATEVGLAQLMYDRIGTKTADDA